MTHLEQYFHISGFTRSYGASIEELKLFLPFLPDSGGVMIDVGSHHGESFLPFLKKGWKIHAFEPDKKLYGELLKKTAGFANIILDNRACSNKPGQNLPWFTTGDSDGAGSMSPFTDMHAQTGTVDTTTLAAIIEERSITHVDLLKIDAGGYDYIVLQAFPFAKIQPSCILCEYEDSKTVPLGYEIGDMINMLACLDYAIYISEWHPIVRYGIRHQWQGFRSWPSKLYNGDSWGNILAFAKRPDESVLFSTVERSIKRFPL